MNKQYYVFVDDSETDAGHKVIASVLMELNVFEKFVQGIKKAHTNWATMPEAHYSELSNDYKREKLANTIMHLLKGSADKGQRVQVAFIEKSKLLMKEKQKERKKKIPKILIRVGVTRLLNREVRHNGVTVKDIFVDEGSESKDPVYKFTCVKKISTKSKAKLPECLRFQNSDHRKVADADKGYSLGIQAADLLAGCGKALVDDPKKLRNKKKKAFIAKHEEYFHRLQDGKDKRGELILYPKQKTVDRGVHKTLSGRKTKYVHTKYVTRRPQLKFTTELKTSS